MFSVSDSFFPLPVVGRGFILVGLSNHIVEQLLSEPKQFRISIWKRFVVVSDSGEKFALFFCHLHPFCFLFHDSLFN